MSAMMSVMFLGLPLSSDRLVCYPFLYIDNVSTQLNHKYKIGLALLDFTFLPLSERIIEDRQRARGDKTQQRTSGRSRTGVATTRTLRNFRHYNVEMFHYIFKI